jgi:hypothetical protein
MDGACYLQGNTLTVQPACPQRICWHGEVRCSIRSSVSVSNKSFGTPPFVSSLHGFQDAQQRIKAWTKPIDDPYIHKDITLAAFLNKRQPNTCLNCLDLPVLDSSLSQPSVISYGAYLSFPSARTDFQNVSRISDNTVALALTARDNFTAVSVDNLRLSRWNLLTHPGFVTGVHKDANGLCTWVYAHQGVKIWGVVKPSHESDLCSKEDRFKLHEAMLAPYGDPLWDSNSDIYTIFLAPGDLLCVSFSYFSRSTFDAEASASCLRERGIWSTLQPPAMSPVDIFIRWSRSI